MADESREDLERLADEPVGYCRPPYEYRWRKGFCPNPKGRPKRKMIVKNVSPPNAFQQRMLEEAFREIARIDGKPITGLDKQLLYLRASDRPDDRKLLLGLYQDAIEADSAWWQSAVLECMDYKAHWGPIFRARRALGLSTPRQFPDPDDIVILSPTRFTFIGPVTEEEAAEWQFFKKGRETFVMVANEIIEAAGWYRPLEDDRQAYLKVRRHYYRVNRHLPDGCCQKDCTVSCTG